MNEWQPIETAPWNRSVLVFIPNIDHYGHGVYRAFRPNFGTPRGWQTTCVAMGRDLSPLDLHPTHWMPLPNPPSPRTTADRLPAGSASERGPAA